MKSLLKISPILLSSLMGLTQLSAQTAADLNEGSRLHWDSAQDSWQFDWCGKSQRTYFLQQSDDLVHWNYLPLVERGTGNLLSQIIKEDSLEYIFSRIHLLGG